VTSPARRYAFESTVEHLATSIRLGVFPAGERLPAERQLAQKLGVSRSTLREAFDALRQSGLVATTRGRAGGTIVVYPGADASEDVTPGGADPGLSAEAITDALMFRRVLEPGAAQLAASVALTGDQRAELVQVLDEACHPVDDVARRVADTRLHLSIAALGGAPSLVEAITRVQGQLRQYLEAIPVLRVNIQHSDTHHRQIVDAVLKGDQGRARAVMEQHCDATSALLRGLLA
jgi:GntR family transcriptional repressor for pyruvate dehydrogenase complex